MAIVIVPVHGLLSEVIKCPSQVCGSMLVQAHRPQLGLVGGEKEESPWLMGAFLCIKLEFLLHAFELFLEHARPLDASLDLQSLKVRFELAEALDLVDDLLGNQLVNVMPALCSYERSAVASVEVKIESGSQDADSSLGRTLLEISGAQLIKLLPGS